MPNGENSSFKNGLLHLSQYSHKKKGFTNELQRLVITVGLFFLLQILFIMIDGTFLEPNLNRIGNFFSGLAADMQLNNKWLFPYDNLIFKFITILAILHIVYLVLKVIVLGLKQKNTRLP